MAGRALVVGGLLSAAGLAMLPAPARALLPPRPQPVWRVGYAWSLTRSAHGLDWGVGVRVPVQTSELGLVVVASSLQATWPATEASNWEFQAGGLIQPYRQQPPYGLFYSLRRFAPDFGEALTGIGFRFGHLTAGYYPGTWNAHAGLSSGSTVAVIEPGWFSGLYVQLRWVYLGNRTSLQFAFGLEEGW